MQGTYHFSFKKLIIESAFFVPAS